jgi:AraC family transcriptional regulator of adaptative response / DNA-3-methyladenine glycosylase II
LGTSAVVRRALRLIDEGILDRNSVEDLANKLGLGARHLHRLFVQHVGASPVSVAQTRRLQFGKRLLDETNLPITEIALAAGFGSLRRFDSAFRQTYGRAPRELRKHVPTNTGSDPGDEVILKLAFRPPYDWDQVREFLAARAIPGVERVHGDAYLRTLRGDRGNPTIISVRLIDSEDALELRVRGAVPAVLFQISSAARRMFDLSADPIRASSAFQFDPLLGPLVRCRPGLRIPGAWDPFECVVCAVLGENGIDSGRTLTARVVDRAGQHIKDPVTGLTHLFPTPMALAKADLNGLGLTKARVGALQELARAIIYRKLDFGAPAENVIATLSTLTRIGSSTAEYVALRALGEPDAFPAGDSVLRDCAGGLTASELEERAEAWRPWRGYAAFHLWSAASSLVRQNASDRKSTGTTRSPALVNHG